MDDGQNTILTPESSYKLFNQLCPRGMIHKALLKSRLLEDAKFLYVLSDSEYGHPHTNVLEYKDSSFGLVRYGVKVVVGEHIVRIHRVSYIAMPEKGLVFNIPEWMSEYSGDTTIELNYFRDRATITATGDPDEIVSLLLTL